MIKVIFSEKEIEQIAFDRYHHPHPYIQKKMEVLWLKSQGVSHKKIAQLAGVSKNVVTGYIKQFKEGGLAKIKELRFYQPQSELLQYSTTIEEHFREHPPASLKKATDFGGRN